MRYSLFLLCVVCAVAAVTEFVCTTPKTHEKITKPPVKIVETHGKTTKPPVKTTKHHEKPTKPPVKHAKPPSVEDCICLVESRCRPLPCEPNAGAGGALVCGYYRMTKNYYIDCGEPEKKATETTETAWKRCAMDKTCSSKCMKAYVNRYKALCHGKSTSETIARLHNGGPNGCNNPVTVNYWKKIQKCCKCK